MQASPSGGTSLWPVYLADVMQQDTPMLFELGDIVTWPVCVADVSGPQSSWPEDVAIETTVSLQAAPNPAARGRLAVTPELSVCWRGDEPVGSQRRVRAGLFADFFNPPFRTYVTGTVRRIEITSSPYAWRDRGIRSAWYPDGPWDLRNVRVAPLSFDRDHQAGPSARREHGLLIHLELITTRCRCQEIRRIVGDRATDYARRHLTETGGRGPDGMVDYVCPVTHLAWRLDHPKIQSGWRPGWLRQLDAPGPPSAGQR